MSIHQSFPFITKHYVSVFLFFHNWELNSFPQVVILCTTSVIFGTCMWFFLQSAERTSLVYAPTVIFACMTSFLTLVTPTMHQEMTGNQKVGDQSAIARDDIKLTGESHCYGTVMHWSSASSRGGSPG